GSADPRAIEEQAARELERGDRELATGNATAALAAFNRARDQVLALRGDRHPDLALYADRLAAAYRARGRLREALRQHDRSLAFRRAALEGAEKAHAERDLRDTDGDREPRDTD